MFVHSKGSDSGCLLEWGSRRALRQLSAFAQGSSLQLINALG